MKKLKLFIALAILPVVLTACGKSETEKKTDKANGKIAQAEQVAQVIDAQYEKIRKTGAVSDQELVSLRDNLSAYINLIQEAVAIDDANSDIKWADRDKADAVISYARERLQLVEAEIARRAKEKADAEKKAEQKPADQSAPAKAKGA